jgi:CRP-like cAMP-binding protein
MSENKNAELERLDSVFGNLDRELDSLEYQGDSQDSNNSQNRKTTTEMLMKSIRFMTPSEKLKKNKKLLSSVMSFREAMLRNLMNKQRSDNEAWSLYEYVREFKFFQQYVNIETMENEAVLHICKNIKYEKYKKDDVIFKEGDQSNGKVYIIFSGSIKVVVNQMDVYEKENFEHSFMQPVSTNDHSTIEISDTKTSPSAHQSRRASLNIMEDDQNCFSTPQSPRLISKPRQSVDLSKNHYLKLYTNLDNDIKASEDDRRKSRFGESNKKSISPSQDSSVATSRTESSVVSAEGSRKDSLNINSFKSEHMNPTVFNPKELRSMNKRPSSGKNRKNNRTNIHRLALLKSTLEKGMQKPLELPGENADKKDKKRHELGFVRSIISDRGAFFGEKALQTDAIRGASIVANANLELLVLTKEVFKYIKKVFDREKRELKDFLMKYIPHLDVISSPQILEGFMFSFKEVFFEFGNHLITEGDFGDTVYLLYQGSAEVYRTVIIHEPDTTEVSIKKVKEFYASKRKTREAIVLSGISVGTFIGEEIILKDIKRYLYSVKVTSDKARFLAITKLKINGRFPEESQKRLREIAKNKKSQREAMFLEMLSKRTLKPMGDNLDTFPLNVQREKNLEIFSSIDRRINSKPMFSTSYKILTPRIEVSTPVASAKRDTPKNSNIEEDKTSVLQMLTFSRKNYMPIRQLDDKKDDENRKESPEKIDKEDKNNSIFQNVNIKRAISPTNSEKRKSNPIRSDESNFEFKNINQYYDQVLGKFGINDLLKDTKTHIEDVNYFKLDFGTKDSPKKQRFLPSLDSKPRERIAATAARDESRILEPVYKKSSVTAGGERKPKPITDIMKTLDETILEKPKRKDKENEKVNHQTQDSIEYFIIKPGGQILMPLFSDRGPRDSRKTISGFNKSAYQTVNKTTGQFTNLKSPRARVAIVNPSIPIGTQKLINRLKKSIHKPTESKIEKSQVKIHEVQRLKSPPKQVSMEVCYYSGLQNSPPKRFSKS